MIFVTVGTHEQPFNRLIQKVDELKRDGIMPQVDAFIGDYSSASLQFLLVDKPNFFVVPDIEEYGKNRGFCFDNPEEYMAGPIIKTQEELYKEFEKLKVGMKKNHN